jgi:Uma2 family endonuclease
MGMTAILEIPEVRERVSRLSVEEYHRLGELNEDGRRTELIRGIVIEKMSKSPLHRSVCSRLYKMLLAKLPAGYSVWKEEPLTLADSEPEPGISVTVGGDETYRDCHPGSAELVVEVAISSAVLDRANASLYAEAGVKEYWIVLAGKQQIEVYRDPENGTYRETILLESGATVECKPLRTVRFVVSELFS